MGAHSNLGVFEDYSVTTGGITQPRASTNYIDTAVTKPKLGIGQHAPYLCIRTAVAPSDPTDTLSIELQCHDDSGFGSGTPATTYDYAKAWTVFGGPKATNELHADVDLRLTVAGAWIYRGQLPYECDEQYIQLYYNNAASGGAFFIDAWLSDSPASDFRGSQVLFSNVGQP